MRLCLLLCALALASCDSGDSFPPSLGFEAPETVVAGTPFNLTVRSTSDRPFTSATVFVFRGPVTSSTSTADTLVAVSLDIPDDGAVPDQTVPVTIPADAVTEAATGTIVLTSTWISGRGFMSSAVEIVPAP